MLKPLRALWQITAPLFVFMPFRRNLKQGTVALNKMMRFERLDDCFSLFSARYCRYPHRIVQVVVGGG